MIHPDTEVNYINGNIGYGVFATKPILKGTVVYIKDMLEIGITRYQYSLLSDNYKKLADKFSYIDEKGTRIISWDNAKYVNHKCDCNTMSTAYGFEIAIKDINEGDEITDEYGLFNIPFPLEISCNCIKCRKILKPSDIDIYHKKWDKIIIDAMKYFQLVDQPLFEYMDIESKKELNHYLNGKSKYTSIIKLKYVNSRQREVATF